MRTITNLRLDLESAMKGKTWLLLPDGYREPLCAKTYPLPGRGTEIAKIANIYIEPMKRDGGTIYIKRALAKHKLLQRKRQSVELDIGRHGQRVADMTKNHKQLIQAMRKDMRAKIAEATEEVQRKATEAIASLTDLFALGRKGLDEQMRACLAGDKWHGEKIDARAFRDAFRMVTQAVGKMGLPSEQRDKAKESVLEEYAAALKATRGAVQLASEDEGGDPPTAH